jgi:hypothetical protein
MLNANDVVIALATLLGPLFAVQVQVWLERGRARKARQQQIFYALMRTRASSLVPEHVHALNSIPMRAVRVFEGRAFTVCDGHAV